MSDRGDNCGRRAEDRAAYSRAHRNHRYHSDAFGNHASNLLRKRAHSLLHVRIEVVWLLFAFWALQLMAWIGMMLYVQFFNRRLGDNVLYVTQISHWALVLSCGTAATATWALIQSKANHRKLERMEEGDER